MKKFNPTFLATAVISLLTINNSAATMKSQTMVETLSQQLQVNYNVIDNHAATHGVDCSALGADWAACSKINLTLTNNGEAITERDWAIYFHHIRMILAVNNEQFKITHITGDLHKLEPTEKFSGIPAHSAVDIPLISEYWVLSESDVMPRWYITYLDSKPKIITNTDTESDDLSKIVSPITDQWRRTPDDHNHLVTPSYRFQYNADITPLSADVLRGQILPTPSKLTVKDDTILLNNQGVNLVLNGLNPNSLAVLKKQFNQLNIAVTDAGYKIVATLDPQLPAAIAGAYQLDINHKQATITAYDESGIFYAVQSLLSSIPAKSTTFTALTAEDAPRFAYRGIMLDIGRNFKSKAAILRLLDQMAVYKMNKFHFHLTDDEGWRIEIPDLPELTEVGSQRCHDLKEQHCLLPQLGSGPYHDNTGSGYLSRADYIDIIKYANARFIQVIPEIDMPAHTRAAVISMEARYQRLMAENNPQQANEYRLIDPTDTSNTTSVQFYNRLSYLNPCLESSKRFVNKVIDEIVKMHNEAEQPITTWHFGGDEAKNIRLGAGYQDIHAKEKSSAKGTIDQHKEDYPWAKSQACQTMIAQGIVNDVQHLPSYFATEVSKIINQHGIKHMQAWQDGVKYAENARSFAVDNVTVNFWDTLYWGGYDSVNQWANKGYQVIISNPDYVYLDMPYEVNPKESGYYWATRFNDERKIFSFAPNNLPQNAETSLDRDGNKFSAKGTQPWPGAYGLSAQIWTEDIRSDEKMDYMTFPRLLAVAERAWHQADWELAYQHDREFKAGETHYIDQHALLNDWNHFANLVGQRELAKLDLAGIHYRLPIPGAKLVDQRLEANIVFPGLTIEYSVDDGNNWQIYHKPTSVKAKQVLIRSRSNDGKRTSRIEKVQ
ncbi:beta-N-acetylhexosaminidase [Candidatus Schmidhempelia bombi]|uniref:beta-N-acetylhexosaminidase n=1 Tax=Candidatus Schmidhempelia bombi str. Bimp TaxID=1387197 RepID=A0AB94ICC6_9GAMM|nr:beta-N-acetylhexosaminidase [Candidatus Schmidhempelia bombi]TEA27069.1 beta-N-acetylhexosaminidase [Candidatus Schmidhempelia bombi str. Bimp]